MNMIKPIEEIPKNTAQQRESYRDKIRADITEAMKKGIGKFEFVGDYNFKYLAQYAREEADRMFRKRFRDLVLPHYPEWKERFQQKYIFLSEWDFRRYNPVKISYIKDEKQGKRVFCEVSALNEKGILEDCEARLAEHQRRDQEESAQSGNPKLKMEADEETETFYFSEELQ